MKDSRFPAILEIKMAGVVEALMNSSGMTLDNALAKVYHSQVYRALEREDTKLWHHSHLLLLDCLISEFDTGVPEFPDE